MSSSADWEGKSERESESERKERHNEKGVNEKREMRKR